MEQALILKLLEKARVDIEAEIIEDKPVLHVNGKVFGTLGNFSVITGRAKSRKTFSVTLAVAAALGDSVQGVITSSFPEDKRKVLIFDTEQSVAHVQKLGKRVIALAGTENAKNVEIFALREFNHKYRKAMIQLKIEQTEGLGLVVIDGARDLVSSINSEEEASDCTQYLMTLTSKHDIHIITVLHQNKGSDHLRGHLGTELQNKAETVVEVKLTTDKTRSNFTAYMTRNIEFDGFQFHINDEGIPVIDDGMKLDLSKPKGKLAPADIEASVHDQIIDQLDGETQYDRSGILTKLSGALKEVTKISYGEKKVADFLNHYVTEGYLVMTGTAGSKTVRYQVAREVEEEGMA
jgi:hypothetical protein